MQKTKERIIRTEDIKNSTLDFIEVDVKNDPNIKDLFATHGKNLYAYGKRYVELKLYDFVAKDGAMYGFNNIENKAKVIILRMDGITPENPTQYSDGTFLQALSKPETSLNFLENRYPVFPSQISRVLIGAIKERQEKNIKVYHIAGTEKNKGLTKAQMIMSILQPKVNVTIDRYMSDTNSKLVADNYEDGVEGDFIKKLETLYKNIKPTAGGSRKKR